jgi:hypothetical protein
MTKQPSMPLTPKRLADMRETYHSYPNKKCFDKIEELWAEIEALQAEATRLRTVVGFFSSVIKSGEEDWTDECQAALDGGTP